MLTYPLLSDNELISLLKEEDHIAYTEIYNRYYYLMFVFAYKKLRDEDMVKDFVQELFTKLWVKRNDILENGNLAQYLYISLRSRIFDYFARQKVQAKYIDHLKNVASEKTSVYSDHLIREKQLAAYIEIQINNLPAKMKKAFELSRKENLSIREIAKQLNTTESNVSHHINNAIKILKTKLSIIISVFFL